MFYLPTGSANRNNVAGRADELEADEFRKLGVNAVVDKPFTREKLVETSKTIFMKQSSEASLPSSDAASTP